MNKTLRLAICIAGLLSFGTASAQQKLGHIDYGAVLQSLPEVKRANTEIENLQQMLGKQAQEKESSYSTKLSKAMEDAQKGVLSPAQQQQIEAELEKLNQEYQQFVAKAEEDITKKRETLLAPILQKIEEAVKAVAKEKGIAYIMDVSTLLYHEGGMDVTQDVKAKLGAQ